MRKNFWKKGEKMQTQRPKIGVFDSGIGGLTVLKECFRMFPTAEYYYLGDNERAPYGNRSEREIVSFVGEALGIFQTLGADAVVLACNTATAVCLEEMRRKFPFPIIGTEPAVRLAAKECKRSLVLSTVRTAASVRLKKLIDSERNCEFTVLPCADLAAEIERCIAEKGEFGKFVHAPIYNGPKPDGVVLGCTHYVFFKDELAAIYGCKAFDGNVGVAKSLFTLFNLGRTDHHGFIQNQNICFEKNIKEWAEKQIVFLGNAKYFNEKIFYSNICFK